MSLLLKALVTQRFFLPVFTYRLYNLLDNWPRGLRQMVQWRVRLLHRSVTASRCMQIPLTCTIGPGLYLNHAYGLILNGGAVIGANATLLQHVTIGSSKRGIPRLGNNVILAAGVIVIGPVTLGDGCTIGAGSVVLHDVPALQIFAGNPARMIGTSPAPRTPQPAPLFT